jgi:hypothetical protein
MVHLKRDIWSLRGALKKYAKGKKFDWKKIREAAHRAAAGRHIRTPRPAPPEHSYTRQ